MWRPDLYDQASKALGNFSKSGQNPSFISAAPADFKQSNGLKASEQSKISSSPSKLTEQVQVLRELGLSSDKIAKIICNANKVQYEKKARDVQGEQAAPQNMKHLQDTAGRKQVG